MKCGSFSNFRGEGFPTLAENLVCDAAVNSGRPAAPLHPITICCFGFCHGKNNPRGLSAPCWVCRSRSSD